jgi:predicted metal-binding membrane protein
MSLLSPTLALVNARLGGAVLVLAGIYQFTGVKGACLSRCRSPFSLLLHDWRPGLGGSLRMGIAQGLACVGCCAALMLVLFVVGVMNWPWVMLLAVIVFVEKTGRGGPVFSRMVGGGLVVAGAAALLSLGPR